MEVVRPQSTLCWLHPDLWVGQTLNFLLGGGNLHSAEGCILGRARPRGSEPCSLCSSIQTAVLGQDIVGASQHRRSLPEHLCEQIPPVGGDPGQGAPTWGALGSHACIYDPSCSWSCAWQAAGRREDSWRGLRLTVPAHGTGQGGHVAGLLLRGPGSLDLGISLRGH